MDNDQVDEGSNASGPDVRDGMLLVGLALIAVGMWAVWWPGSAIIPGLVLTAVAVFGVR